MAKYRESEERFLFTIWQEGEICLHWNELPDRATKEDRERIYRIAIDQAIKDGSCDAGKKVFIHECCCEDNFDHFLDKKRVEFAVDEATKENRHEFFASHVIALANTCFNSNDPCVVLKEDYISDPEHYLNRILRNLLKHDIKFKKADIKKHGFTPENK